MRFTSIAIMIREESEFRRRLSKTSFARRLSVRFGIVILVISSCFFALTIPVSLSKSPEVPLDMFADYVDFFPGQYWSPALERSFRCNVDLPSGEKYCFLSPQNSLFVNVGVTISNSSDQIMRIVFSLYENTLKVGDIAAWWGKPEIQIAGYLAYLDWRDQKIKAIAYIGNGRFDYFSPLVTVIFY